MIEEFEGLRLTAYKCSSGVWTIGYGHTENVKQGDVITLEEAKKLLKEDTEVFRLAIETEEAEDTERGTAGIQDEDLRL